MTFKFVIFGRLAGMNELISANRANKYKGAKLKEDAQKYCSKAISKQLGRLAIKRQVFIEYKFYEPNRRRDLDNISGFAHKVIQDALVESGVLKNDGWDYIAGYRDVFFTDSKLPRIEVSLTEVRHE